MATQYVGKMFDGQMHGPGKLIYENEEYYSGEFVRGESHVALSSAKKRSNSFASSVRNS